MKTTGGRTYLTLPERRSQESALACHKTTLRQEPTIVHLRSIFTKQTCGVWDPATERISQADP